LSNGIFRSYAAVYRIQLSITVWCTYAIAVLLVLQVNIFIMTELLISRSRQLGEIQRQLKLGTMYVSIHQSVDLVKT